MDRFRDAGAKVSWWDKTLGTQFDKAKRLLGWKPISNEDCIVATAESLIKLGLLKDSPKKAA